MREAADRLLRDWLSSASTGEDNILDYCHPDLALPASPAPLPGDVGHVQVRTMRREEMQPEIAEPIVRGVAGYVAGPTAVSQNERFSRELPNGEAYAVVSPKFAW